MGCGVRQDGDGGVCRVYAERFSSLGIRLYITKIRDGDDGIYTCKARLSDTQQMMEQDTKMFLYGTTTIIIIIIGLLTDCMNHTRTHTHCAEWVTIASLFYKNRGHDWTFNLR